MLPFSVAPYPCSVSDLRVPCVSWLAIAFLWQAIRVSSSRDVRLFSVHTYIHMHTHTLPACAAPAYHGLQGYAAGLTAIGKATQPAYTSMFTGTHHIGPNKLDELEGYLRFATSGKVRAVLLGDA